MIHLTITLSKGVRLWRLSVDTSDRDQRDQGVQLLKQALGL